MKIGRYILSTLITIVSAASLSLAETPTSKNMGASPRLLTPQNSALIYEKRFQV